MAESEYIKEPKRDCVLCEQGRDKCRALNDLYCAKELKPCAFYKSRYEYGVDGKLLEGDKG